MHATAVLHAYLAGNLATELYNSNQAAASRDHFGSGNKFIVPVVVDGKVFSCDHEQCCDLRTVTVMAQRLT